MGSDAQGGGETGDDARERVPPGVFDALKELGDTGRATWAAGREAATALRILVTADFALARSALGRTIALTAAASSGSARRLR